MAELREFLVAAEEASDIAEQLPSGKPLEFKLNGRTMVAHPPANSGPLVYLIAMQASDASSSDGAYSIFTFFKSILSEEDAAWVRNSLAIGELNFTVLGEVFNYLLEEWTARPTTPPRGSSSRRRSTGASSTVELPSSE